MGREGMGVAGLGASDQSTHAQSSKIREIDKDHPDAPFIGRRGSASRVMERPTNGMAGPGGRGFHRRGMARKRTAGVEPSGVEGLVGKGNVGGRIGRSG
jgi:hypothetical protein